MANKETVTKEIDQPFHAQNSTTKQLKEFLKERGVQVSGTRSCLLKRVEGLLLFETRKSRTAERSIDPEKNTTRFLTPLGENLPQPESLCNWDKDLNKIPMFTDKELYNYLVLNKERTCDGASNNASRQLKAKVFYEDNHVHSISYHGINESMSHCYVSCKVIPSCPTGKKEDYRVWVCMSKVTGHVHSACCTCIAG